MIDREDIEREEGRKRKRDKYQMKEEGRVSDKGIKWRENGAKYQRSLT